MLQPESVTIQDGYQLCGVCGELLLNGDTTSVMALAYAHPTCVTDTCVPQEWKVARRVDAYNQTNPDTTTEEYWENQLIEFKNYQREAQMSKFKKDPFKEFSSDDENADREFIPSTGQKRNGSPLVDCREVAQNMAGWCDVSKVARLMVEITDRQIMAEERANLYVTWTRPQLEQDAAENFGRPMFSNSDERTSLGKDRAGLDAVPQDEVFTDESETADDGYEEAGFN